MTRDEKNLMRMTGLHGIWGSFLFHLVGAQKMRSIIEVAQKRKEIDQEYKIKKARDEHEREKKFLNDRIKFLLETKKEEAQKKDALIAGLQAELEEAKSRKHIDPEEKPDAALHLLESNDLEEKKRGRGRPRIDSKRFEMRLDLDIAFIAETVAKTQKRSLARIINELLKNYLASEYPELMEEAKGRTEDFHSQQCADGFEDPG